MFGRKSSDKVKGGKAKRIEGGAWGHLVSEHGIIVDVLDKWRSFDQPGEVNGQPVTLLRIFDPQAAQQRGIALEGWGTLEEHPELVLFEGYVDAHNNARLEKRN